MAKGGSGSGRRSSGGGGGRLLSNVQYSDLGVLESVANGGFNPGTGVGPAYNFFNEPGSRAFQVSTGTRKLSEAFTRLVDAGLLSAGQRVGNDQRYRITELGRRIANLSRDEQRSITS